MSTQFQVPSIFSFQSINVRAFADDNGEPWFCASDVCEVLGYTNSRKAISDHCRKRGVTKRYTPTDSGDQEMSFINEGNLYRLITRSKKQEAEEFEIKVMEEILPAIRKTGSYTLPQFITPAQQNALQQLAASKAGESGSVRAYIWSRFNNHFQLGSYKQLPAEKFAEAVSYLSNMPVKETKKLSTDNAGRYHYPRKLLEQCSFVSADGKHPARLDISMLTNTKVFISPLMHLLNEMRIDGHDVSAPWDEAIAMREALITASEALDEIFNKTVQARFMSSASVTGNK